ncbi:CotH kinase family protein, partial [Candidatus Altiarchaeota archaeon]
MKKKRNKISLSFVVKVVLILIIGILTLHNFHIILSFKDIVESDKYLSHPVVTLSNWYEGKNREYTIYFHDLFVEEEEIIDGLEELRIYIDVLKLNELDSALPESGREWKKAELVYNDTIYKIRLRYRGDSSYHWHFPKKSLKINLRDKKKLFNHGIIQLTNIKSGNLLVEYVGNELAKKFGLLTVEEKYMKVYINDKYAGLYLYLEPQDKAFLETKNRAEGDIYSGDIVQDDAPVGLSHNLFDAVHSWDPRLMMEFESVDKKSNLNRLIKLVNEILILDEGSQELRDIIDIEYFENFTAWTTFIRTWHMNHNHNTVLYYDYTDGRFIQIPWDNGAFDNSRVQFDWVSNDLFLALHKNPVFYTNKLRILHQFMVEDNGVDQTLQLVNDTLIQIENASKYDKFKGRAPIRIPLSEEEYERKNKLFINRILKNNLYLAWFRKVNVSYYQDTVNNSLRLDVGVSGWSSAVLESIKLSRSCKGETILKDFNLNGINDDYLKFKSNTTLYSGRTHPDASTDSDLNRRSGTLHYPFLFPAEHVYTFFINVSNPGCRIEGIVARNLITGRPVKVREVAEPLKEDKDIFSIHPWRLESEEAIYLSNMRRDILSNYPSFNLSDTVLYIGPGKFEINETIIIPRQTTTYILPGTELIMFPNVSIMSYGRVIAEGTIDTPIKVFALDASRPWHVFALVNEYAENSTFSYVEFSDGYEAFIKGIYFSGMFNAYHVNNVLVDHCTFTNAHADDALNFKNSNSNVTNSQFVNNSADAIDYDFMTGVI